MGEQTIAHSEESVETIRSVGRTCRGKRFATIQEAAKYAYDQTREAEASFLLDKFAADDDPQGIINELLAIGNLDEASRLDALTRIQCGYDVNDLILAQPLDGRPKTAECPRCGQQMSWRPPRLDAEEE